MPLRERPAIAALAMALAVAGLIAAGETTIDRAESVDISYPAFWREIEALTAASAS